MKKKKKSFCIFLLEMKKLKKNTEPDRSRLEQIPFVVKEEKTSCSLVLPVPTTSPAHTDSEQQPQLQPQPQQQQQQ